MREKRVKRGKGVAKYLSALNAHTAQYVAGQLQAKSASSTFTSSHNVTLGAWESWEWHSVAAADSSLVVLNGAEQAFTGTWSLQTGATGLKIGMCNTTELDGRFNFNGYLRTVILKRAAMSAGDKSVLRVGLGM